jgi:tetratricopeptide (TPR) repeat protein
MGSGAIAVTSLGAVLFCLATDAAAQTASTIAPKSAVAPASNVNVEAVQAQRTVLFQHMLDHPDDLDAAFKYAELSIQVGDLEAAVSTLERMLIYSPGLPRLQLELGVLYYRLAAFETARSYFEAAVSGPDVPEEVRSKVRSYLDSIDETSKPWRFTGQVRAGYRYQTDANRAPTGSTVILNGLPFTLDSASTGAPDSNVYGAGVFHYSVNLPSQGDTIEADLVTYGSKQFEQDDLNLALAELTVGPAFDLQRFDIDNAVLGVYGISSMVFLNGHFYSVGYGAGTRLVTHPNPDTLLTTALEYRQRDYHDSAIAPTADDRDGGEIRGFTTATYVLDPRLALNAFAYAQHDTADKGYLAYSEAGFSAGPIISFDALIGSGEPWILAPSAGLVWREYDDPDPAISASEAEHDLEAFVSSVLTIPLRDEWALLTEAEYRHVDSNYSIREYDNFTIAVSFVKGF